MIIKFDDLYFFANTFRFYFAELRIKFVDTRRGSFERRCNLFSRIRIISAVTIGCNLRKGETTVLRVLMQRGLARFAVYRAIRLWGLAFASRVCVPRRRRMQEAREKGARERSGRRPREETRRTTEEGKGTNAVGGSWRRNDYRPRTHSLPAIISSTNATKSIRRLFEPGGLLAGRSDCSRTASLHMQ